jgi:hypothetical protein
MQEVPVFSGLEIALPPRVSGRDLARAAAAVIAPVEGEDVLIDATLLKDGEWSFAVQLVQSILIEGGAQSLTIHGGPDDFTDSIKEAAQHLGVLEFVHEIGNDQTLAS